MKSGLGYLSSSREHLTVNQKLRAHGAFPLFAPCTVRADRALPAAAVRRCRPGRAFIWSRRTEPRAGTRMDGARSKPALLETEQVQRVGQSTESPPYLNSSKELRKDRNVDVWVQRVSRLSNLSDCQGHFQTFYTKRRPTKRELQQLGDSFSSNVLPTTIRKGVF